MTHAASVELIRRDHPGSVTVRLERMEYGGGAVTHRVHVCVESWERFGHDYYECDALDLAQAVLEEGERRVLAGKDPQLAEIAVELKKRNRGAATARRQIFRADGRGTHIMGDTPPDEMPKPA